MQCASLLAYQTYLHAFAVPSPASFISYTGFQLQRVHTKYAPVLRELRSRAGCAAACKKSSTSCWMRPAWIMIHLLGRKRTFPANERISVALLNNFASPRKNDEALEFFTSRLGFASFQEENWRERVDQYCCRPYAATATFVKGNTLYCSA